MPISFEENVFRPFHTLRELITYIPTEFRESYLDWGAEIRPKTKWAPRWFTILTSVIFWGPSCV